MSETAYIEEALALAARGRRATHPNPLVGAMIVSTTGDIVGRGYHRGPGTPHAEAAALAEAGERAAGGTIYVTLEPCSHQGRTPPCADAIVAAGIGRVVAAMEDPNPLVDGKGFARLRAAGIAVDMAAPALRARAEELNAAFLKFTRTGLPLVTLKFAVSLDGKVAAPGGDSRWISGAGSRRRVHVLRAAADAVLIGAGTLRRDDPRLTVRDADGEDPAAVVVSRDGELPLEAGLFAGAAQRRTIVVCAELAEPRAARLRELGVETIVTGHEGGLEAGLRRLAQAGLLDLFCEGGPGLAASLLREGLVDRLVVFVAPLLVGRGGIDIAAFEAGAEMSQALRLTGARWEVLGEDAVVTASLPSAKAAGGSSLMFTGIIEEIGRLRRLDLSGSSGVLEIEAATVLEGTVVGDSVACAGVCLTVIRLGHDRFWADAMPETIRRTTLGEMHPGGRLNLERALTFQSRLGGHLVQGHADGVGTVTAARREESALVISLRAPGEVAEVSVPQGSIAVDGVSLTLTAVAGDLLTVSLIPHTAAATTLAGLDPGARVNLEADLIGKYVHTFLRRSASGGQGLTWEKLSEAGFS